MMRNHVLTLNLALAVHLPYSSSSDSPAKTLFSLPSPANASWFENLAYRPSTDTILATRLDIPQLWSISARTGAGTLLANVTDTTALVGITQTRSYPPFDEFYVAGVNLSEGIVQPDSSMLWRLTFAPGDGGGDDEEEENENGTTTTGIGNFTLEPAFVVPGIDLINGIATWDEHTILAADSYLGAIWAVDLRSGSASVALQDPDTMAPVTALGVNGVKALRSVGGEVAHVYYTSTDHGLVARVPVDHAAATLRQCGEVEVLARRLGEVDDFALLESSGGVLVATGWNNSVVHVGLDGRIETVAGGPDSLKLASTTACQLGAAARTAYGGRQLYVTTAGGLEGPAGIRTTAGSVVAVELESEWL